MPKTYLCIQRKLESFELLLDDDTQKSSQIANINFHQNQKCECRKHFVFVKDYNIELSLLITE